MWAQSLTCYMHSQQNTKLQYLLKPLTLKSIIQLKYEQLKIGMFRNTTRSSTEMLYNHITDLTTAIQMVTALDEAMSLRRNIGANDPVKV